MDTLLMNTLNGLSWGMLLFLIAVGLTTVFGVLGVLNFAHGSLFMLGAYLCMLSMQFFESFWLGLAVGPLCVVAIGVLIERFLLKKVYTRDVSYQLLLTFAVLLVLDDAVRMIWGSGYHVVEPPLILSGIVDILGHDYPVYRFFLIFIGPVIGGLLWAFFHFARWGKIIRAASFDNIMAEGVGINVPILYTTVFALGTWLAAVGGALAAPSRAWCRRWVKRSSSRALSSWWSVAWAASRGRLPARCCSACWNPSARCSPGACRWRFPTFCSRWSCW